MTYFNLVTNSGQSFSVKYDNLNLLFATYIFISGMISISAKVLPGISGSTILLIFGFYVQILNGIKQILKLNYRSYDRIYILSYNGPTSLEIPKLPMSASTFSIVFFIIGCTLVPALEKLKEVLKNKEIESGI